MKGGLEIFLSTPTIISFSPGVNLSSGATNSNDGGSSSSAGFPVIKISAASWIIGFGSGASGLLANLSFKANPSLKKDSAYSSEIG